MPRIEHWMLFSTFAEQRHFVFPSVDTYNGVIINANMAAYAPAGLASFLTGRTSDLPYIIDPLTHAFQHEPSVVQNDNQELKSSVAAMAEAYGRLVASKAGKQPLIPSDFKDDEQEDEFVEKCCAFQADQLRIAIQNSENAKYLENDNVPPRAIVAPYFYITAATLDRWKEVVHRLTNKSVQLCREKGVSPFAAIVIGRGLIASQSQISRLLTVYEELELDGFILWVDDFDEHTAETEELKVMLELGKELRKLSSCVINLHGSYFSVLASGMFSDRACSGVAHAPEYGEYRPVIPVGGGIPVAKYYVPQLHERVRFRDAAYLLNAKDWLQSADRFHDNVCDCDTCRQTLNGDPDNFGLFGETGVVRNVRRGHGFVRMEFPSSDAKKRCLEHYLRRKALEYDEAATAEPTALLEKLKTTADDFEDILGIDGVSYLRNWYEVLSSQR